jgi:hypothetical protein
MLSLACSNHFANSGQDPLGAIGSIPQTAKTLAFIDASEAGCADGCQRAMIVAQLGQGRNNAA